MYDVRFMPEAQEFYVKAERPLARKLVRCFEQLSIDPHQHPNIKRLKGEFSGSFRFRVGDYRVIYEINEPAQVVKILLIAHRSDAYE